MFEARTPNPLTEELASPARPDPCTLVIVGGSGDLSQRKLLPAIYNAVLDGLVPVNFAILGFARRDHSEASFRAFAKEGIERFSRRPVEESQWQNVEPLLHYVRGSLADREGVAALRTRLQEIEAGLATTGNRIFYLAIPPGQIQEGVEQLRASGLVAPADGPGPWTRVIVEKPVGRDLASARQANATLGRIFDERQIYRIDHDLGKETLQNLMVIRFANSIFEPLWNYKYIDHVQITVAEDEGVGARAGCYEESGALRDMIQNHVLQLVCLTAMEPTAALDQDVIRDRTLEVLKSLRPMARSELAQSVIRAQYAPGLHRGSPVPGYLSEAGVKPGSTAETFVALRLFIDNWRWAGVPFYLRTGKRMSRRASEIAVAFKHVPPVLFNTDPEHPLSQNILALRIQPEEGLTLRLSSKVPGPVARVYPVRMDIPYGSPVGKSTPTAYERLLVDVMAGDATLFMRRDGVEASWAWIDPIVEGWEKSGVKRLPEYPAGTWGPIEAARLLQIDGRDWRTP
jgi:glucose-6-phosphate 1-dehydrogenase